MFKKSDKTNEAAKFVDREKVKHFESQDTRKMFLVMQNGHAIANIRVSDGADVEDAKSFAQHHYPGAEVRCLSDLLYEELENGDWKKEIEAVRQAGFSTTSTFVKLMNAVIGKLQSPGHTVGPSDAAKKKAYLDKLEASRRKRATTTKPNSNVHPRLAKAISALEKAEKEIEELRKEIAAEQAAKITKMVAARETAVYYNARGERVRP